MSERNGIEVIPYHPDYLADVVDIEKQDDKFPWSEIDFCEFFNYSNESHGLIAKIGAKVVGFLIITLRPGCVDILKIKVSNEHRRQGVGSELLGALLAKTWPNTLVGHCVRETDLASQLFLKDKGFTATFLAEAFADELYLGDDEDAWKVEDGYHFTLRTPR